MSGTRACRGCGREVGIEVTRCPECGAVLETVFTGTAGQPFDEFISGLSQAHKTFQHQLSEIGTALRTADLPAARARLQNLRESLDRHVVDEEARILRILIDAHGRDGARDAIRTMQQHRRVHVLAADLAGSLSSSSAAASAKHAELAALLTEHMEAEEKRIFPWVLDTERKRARK